MPKHFIPRSPIEYENTGIITQSTGRQYKVIGFDIQSGKAIVKNPEGVYAEMTNNQVDKLAKL